jgi:hypothetical protein
VEIAFNRDHDPDGSKLRRLLEACSECERMSAARSFSVHLLAIVSVFVWLEAEWPSLLPADMRILAVGLWGMFFCLALWMSMEEWIWRRRREDYFAQYHESRREPSNEHGAPTS